MDEYAGDRARPVQVLPVLGGAVLGFGGTWVLWIVTFLVTYSQFQEASGFWSTVAFWSAIFGVPLLSALLLIPRRTRQWGAGFVIGVAIGAISAAGVCGGFIGLNSL